MSKLPVKLKKQNIFEQFYNYIKKFLKVPIVKETKLSKLSI